MNAALRITLLALALAAPMATRAAGFDCTKATTKIEKTICADPALSALDGELAAEYRAALLRGGDARTSKAKQSEWLRKTRDACRDRDCLREAYAARIAVLKGQRATFPDLPGAIVQTCADLAAAAQTDATGCRVTESGSFGKVGDEEQSYAVYCLENLEGSQTCATGAVALFTVAARNGHAERWLQRADSAGDGNVYEKPVLLQTRQGLLLHLPVSIPGTGDFNASALFRRDGARWTPIDSTSWEKDFAAQLPKGLAVWKGIWPDFRTMTAQTGMYRAKDANCCATGGTAQVKLRLDGDRIVLDSFRIVRSR